MKNNLRFEEIVPLLSQGMIATRASWTPEPSIFVFLQLSIATDQQFLEETGHIPPMLKEIIKQRENPLVDNFHLCILFTDNNYHPFNPSTADLFASDWVVLEAADVMPDPNQVVQ